MTECKGLGSAKATPVSKVCAPNFRAILTPTLRFGVLFGTLIGIVFANLVFTSVSLAPKANAADDNSTSITISPTTSKVELAPGSGTSGEVTIYNTGAKAFDFEVYASPYHVADDSYDPNFDTRDDRSQIADWITFAQKDYSLEPGAKVVVPFWAEAPADAKGGGQYAVIFAETKASTDNMTQTGVVAAKRVGMLFFAKVAGDMFVDGEIVEQKLDFWYQSSPIDSFIRVHNSGNVDDQANYSFSVKSLFGEEIYAIAPKDTTILPSTTRLIPTNFEPQSWGIYNVTQTVTFNGKSGEVSHYVLVAPFSIFLIIGGILILLIVVIIALVKSRKKRKNAPNNTSSRKNFSDADYQEYLKWKEFQASQENNVQGQMQG